VLVTGKLLGSPAGRRRARRRTTRAAAILTVLVLGLVLAACSGESQNTPSSLPKNQPHEQPLQGPPPNNESAQEAVDRIDGTIATGDCDKINQLNPLSRPSLSSDARCQYLMRLGDADLHDVQDFGGLGAVADYARGQKVISVVMIRDRDGLYHVAFIDPFRGTKSVGTPFASAFDTSAETAVHALQDRNCTAFLSVASRRFGFGLGADDTVCTRVDHNQLSNLLAPIGGAVHPQRVGGNGGYAFYSIRTPATFLTIVMAQQTAGKNLPPDIPENLRTLPEGAAEYSYVDAYATNPRGGA
jgi:hypothetical protein